jgi:hypothetical protein
LMEIKVTPHTKMVNKAARCPKIGLFAPIKASYTTMHGG